MLKYFLMIAFMIQMTIPVLCINHEESIYLYCFNRKNSVLTEEEWKDNLYPDPFQVLRKDGTELAFRNAYYDNKKEGVYVCAGCELPVFSSFDSGSGLPRFWQSIFPENVSTKEDDLSTPGTSIVCRRCGSHLGNVQNVGPPPIGQWYCIESAALNFIPQ